jgi:hypothetical protein
MGNKQGGNGRPSASSVGLEVDGHGLDDVSVVEENSISRAGRVVLVAKPHQRTLGRNYIDIRSCLLSSYFGFQ